MTGSGDLVIQASEADDMEPWAPYAPVTASTVAAVRLHFAMQQERPDDVWRLFNTRCWQEPIAAMLRAARQESRIPKIVPDLSVRPEYLVPLRSAPAVVVRLLAREALELAVDQQNAA